jgi:sec-independent protein translocase protein TatB
MFGIGLPEMIVIFAVALIVVGPDKLPGLARSLAKTLMEMKTTLNQVKENLTQEGEVLDSVQKDLRKTADELREKMIDADPDAWRRASGPADKEHEENVIDVEPEPVPPPADAPAGDDLTSAAVVETAAETTETAATPVAARQEPQQPIPPATTPTAPTNEPIPQETAQS